MSYDFRRRKAGQRDLLNNYEVLMDDIARKTLKAELDASRKVLLVAKDLLTNFDLTLVMNKSWIDRYRSGSDSKAVSGCFGVLVGEGVTEEGVKGAIWDATDIEIKKIDRSGELWACRFEAGG